MSLTNSTQKHFHCFHPKDENSPTFIGKTSGSEHEQMDLRTSWARSDEDLPIKPTQQTEPAAIRERSKDTRRSLISLLACSSTSNPSHHTTTSYTSDRRRRSLWRAPGGWLRFTQQQGLPTVNLSHATSSLHSQMNVEVGESLSSQKQNRLNSLDLQAFGLHHINRLTVQSHHTLSILAVGNGHSILLYRVRIHKVHQLPQFSVPTLRPKHWTEGLASVDMI